MAFYLALFNVNHVKDHVNDEMKHSVAHARRSKSVKPVLKDKNRRHSLSTAQEVADYRLLPRPRIIGSSHNLRRLSPSPPPPHRRTSAADTTLCTCDTDSPENGRKKVTFDGEESSMLMVERPRRKLSEGSFLEIREKLNQSSSSHLLHQHQQQQQHPTEMEELSSQRAADWIYSIKLQQKKDRRMSQQERGLLDNGNQITPSTSTAIIDTNRTPPPLPTQTPTPLPSPGPSIVLPIQCDRCRNVNGHCGIDCVPSSNVEPLLIQRRPQSKLPSILRRRSTSDRSASLSVVFRRAMPHRTASPNNNHGSGGEGIKLNHRASAATPATKLRSHIYNQHHQQLHSDNIPLIERERNEMIRSNYY